MTKTKLLAVYDRFGKYIVLIVLCIFFSLTANNFFALNNAMTILRQVSMLGIASIGITLIMISGGMDLSVGAQVALGGVILGLLLRDTSIGIVPCILICMAFGVALGILNGFVAIKLKIFPLIVTLGTMLIMNGLAYVITGGYPVYGLPTGFKIIGQGYIGVVPIPAIIFIVIAIIAGFVLNKTYFGRQIFAVGGNPEAARLAGVNVDRFRVIIYAVGGFITSFTTIILTSRTFSAQPGAGASYTFDCMTACVLGGTAVSGGKGSITGTVIGVMIIGVLNSGLLMLGLDSNWQDVVKGAILILAIGFDALQHSKKSK